MFQPLEEKDQVILKQMLSRYGTYQLLRQIFVIDTKNRKDYHEDAVIQRDTDTLGRTLESMVYNHTLLRQLDTNEELIEAAKD